MRGEEFNESFVRFTVVRSFAKENRETFVGIFFDFWAFFRAGFYNDRY